MPLMLSPILGLLHKGLAEVRRHVAPAQQIQGRNLSKLHALFHSLSLHVKLVSFFLNPTFLVGWCQAEKMTVSSHHSHLPVTLFIQQHTLRQFPALRMTRNNSVTKCCCHMTQISGGLDSGIISLLVIGPEASAV